MKLTKLIIFASVLALAGCAATAPLVEQFSGNKQEAGGGSAAGAASEGQGDLEHCDSTLGTIAVVEDQSQQWWRNYYRRYPTLGSTVPVLRMMIQQSNCFVVVERGRAMKHMMGERALQDSGEMREGSNFGKGQMVAADYTINPSIQFSENTGGLGGAVSGLLGASNSKWGRLAGSLKKNEASTTILLIDNRSGVQLSAAVGSAQKYDVSLLSRAYGSGRWASLGGYSKTPEGKIIIASFTDSLNQMIKALRNYKAQTVEGGLGKGGKLGVGD